MTPNPCPQVEACPACGDTTGVQPITGTSPKVQAWSCTACDTRWAITVVNPQQPAYFGQLCAAVEQLGRLRWTLRQVIALADQAPELTDQELRTRLHALAASCGVPGELVSALGGRPGHPLWTAP